MKKFINAGLLCGTVFLPVSLIAQNSEKPNIIFVLADDLGYGDINAFRPEHEQNSGTKYKKKNGKKIEKKDSKILTPNLDKFAKKGIRFTNFYAGSTVSGPSRCALLTGMHTGNPHLSARFNMSDGDETAKKMYPHKGSFQLSPADFTFPKMLQENGYVTACIGKYGMMGDGAKNLVDKAGNIKKELLPILPSNLGFNYTYGNLDHVSGHFHFQGHDNGNFTGGINAMTWEISEKSPQNSAVNVTPKNITYSEDLFMQKNLEFLEKRAKDKKPFLLYFAPIIPHAGLQLPDSGSENDNVDFSNPKNQSTSFGKGIGSFKYYQEIFAENNWEKNYTGGKGHYGNQKTAHSAQAAMISRLDRDFGQILEFLKEKKLDKNTIIIFTSDNGAHCEGGADPEFFSNNHPIRGIKRDLFEGGVRVPTIVWASENIMPKKKQGTSDERIGAFWDFLPTFATLTKSKISQNVKEKLNGVSLAGMFTGKSDVEIQDYFYWEFPNKQAVRKGDWKAIRLNARNPDSKIQLYNLRNDLLEKNDVAAKNPEIIKQMKKIMQTATTESPNIIIPK